MSDVFETILRRPSADSDEATRRSLRFVVRGVVKACALPLSGQCVMGRGADVDVHIADQSISRLHASIAIEGARMQLQDLGSTNGSRLATEPKLAPNTPVSLEVGQIFLIGDVASVVHEGSIEARASSAIGVDSLIQALEYAVRTHEANEAARPTDSASPNAAFTLCTINGAGAAERLETFAGLAFPRGHVVACSGSLVAILLPRTPRKLAARWLDGVLACMRRVGVDGVAGLRSFPEDGRTVGELWPEGAELEGGQFDRTHNEASAPSAQREVDNVLHGAAMKEVNDLVEHVAPTPASVLIMGETGVGKEVWARAIHVRSRRRGQFVALNCAALPETLLESELFGHEKGSFTGAHAAKEGLVEAASKGTLFLDELGEMPLATQAKLLRVLEERVVLRIGSVKPREVDIRLVAATNRDLLEEIQAKRFRADLYYRLNGIILRLPPLRDRRDEIVPLVRHFVAKAAATLGREVPRIPSDVLEALESYSWPGNVRELRNAVERIVLLARGGVAAFAHLPDEIRSHDRAAEGRPPSSAGAAGDDALSSTSTRRQLSFREDDATYAPGLGRGAPTMAVPAASAGGAGSPTSASLDDDMARLDCAKVVEALEKCAGNQTRAAELLGITRRALIVRMDKYNLPRPRR